MSIAKVIFMSGLQNTYIEGKIINTLFLIQMEHLKSND